MIDSTNMLAHLQSRSSVRKFTGEPVDREALARCLEAAVTAPSATNRQPWRFIVVRAKDRVKLLAELVKRRTLALDEAIRPSNHATEWEGYGDFFWQPLAGCAAIIVPCLPEPKDQIAAFLRSAGADPEQYCKPSSMQPERCALGAAVMALLLQAHTEGLGAVWMAGPMIARVEIETDLDIHAPWSMVGAIAVGQPAEKPEKPPRREMERVVTWIEEEE